MMVESSFSIRDEVESQKIPFQYQTFVDFVGLLGRLFYDDACIVLLDFLAREQKSFLQSDLREKLGWRDALIQQKLYLLEKHMIVVQDTLPNQGPRTPSHWRISHQIYGAVQWRYQQVVDRLDKLVNDASKQHEFECSQRTCEAKYTALEAASCNRALHDEHPLCMRCGSQLKPSEFEETKHQAKEKRVKALQQLQILNQALVKVGNMEIPIFPQYTKKSETKDQQDTSVEMKDESQVRPTKLPTNNSSATQQHQLLSTTPSMSPASSVSGADPPSVKNEKQPTRNFHIDLGTTTFNPQSSRSIPWFQTTNAGSAISRGGETLEQQNDRPLTDYSPTCPTKISFGFKAINKLNAINNLLRTPTSSKTDTKISAIGTNPTVSIPAVLPMNSYGSPTATSSQMLPTNSSSFNIDGVSIDDGDEVEIEVKEFGRKFKLSEVTEEVEQKMSDEEYRVRDPRWISRCGLTFEFITQVKN